MGDIFIRRFHGTLKCRGFTCVDESGDYNVYVNEDLSDAQAIRTLAHELEHIRRGHLHDGRPGAENEEDIKKRPRTNPGLQEMKTNIHGCRRGHSTEALRAYPSHGAVSLLSL